MMMKASCKILFPCNWFYYQGWVMNKPLKSSSHSRASIEDGNSKQTHILGPLLMENGSKTPAPHIPSSDQHTHILTHTLVEYLLMFQTCTGILHTSANGWYPSCKREGLHSFTKYTTSQCLVSRHYMYIQTILKMSHTLAHF